MQHHPTRRTDTFALFSLATLGLTGLLLAAGCSSGLEGPEENVEGREGAVPSTNGRFGFDPGVALTDAITDMAIAGGVVATTTGSREQPVAFVAFSTRSALDVSDGTTDGNGVSDVFLTAIDCNQVDPRAFVHSIAGSMRHPRCVTCHQMNLDPTDPDILDPTAFASQPHPATGQSGPPLNLFSDSTCKDCHFEDWFAPGPTFDLRVSTTRDLFQRAQVTPGGMTEHFKGDARVVWALGNGVSPFNNAADDDHDGIDEPEDHDGVRRFVPGGAEAFFARVDALAETEDPDTGELLFSSAEDAVADLLLVSRAFGLNTAADGASSAPSLVYVPNGAYTAGTVGRAGTLYVAFQSDATDMVDGESNGVTDVFRVEVDVNVAADGSIDLVYEGNETYVSAADGGGESSGPSTAPDIGGDGDRIAFTSEAVDLIAPDLATCRPEVYLWDEVAGTFLVSHVEGAPTTPGNSGAGNPDLSEDGEVVVFETDASNLLTAGGDTNGTRDVFFARWPGLEPERASLDPTGAEFTGHATTASVSHVGGDVRVAFAVQENAPDPFAAVQCPDVVVTLPFLELAQMRESSPTTAFGPGQLYIGETGAGGFGTARSIVRFDLSMLPAGATINSAELTMNVNMVPDGSGAPCPTVNGQPNDMALFAATSSWSGGTVTWNSNANAYSSPASAVQVVTGTGLYTWDTAQTADDVQDWLDSGDNFGWVIAEEDEAAGAAQPCTVKRLDGNFGAAPSLLVDYTPPLRAPQRLGTGTCDVYVRDDTLAMTIDLSEARSEEGDVIAEEIDVDGTPLSANATNPVISPDGNTVLFESMAQNLDLTRPLDENRMQDVVLADLSQFASQGFVLPYTLSVTAEGGSANGPSSKPVIASFQPATDSFPLGLALYATQATNLGDTDPGDLNEDGRITGSEENFLLSFLSEGGGVFADFVAEPARQGQNRKVRFASTSSGNPTEFLWDFGDGTTSTRRAPAHTYDTPGRYTVSLTTSGARGADARTRIDYVQVLDAVSATFRSTKDSSESVDQDDASFDDVDASTTVVGAIQDADPDSRLLFDLDSSGSTEFPESWRWMLQRVSAGGDPIGDATLLSTEQNPEDLAIDRVGLFDLTLEATGPGGAGVATQRVEVYEAVTPQFTTTPAGAPVRGAAPLAVQFVNTTTGDPASTNPWFWSFGDGGFSTDENPMHVFNEGVFQVTLLVDGAGTDNASSIQVPIIAEALITAAYTVDPEPANSFSSVLFGELIDDGSGSPVDFTNLSSNQAGDPMFYYWDFGGGLGAGEEHEANPQDVLFAADPENVRTYAVRMVASTTNPAPTSCGGQPAGTCDEEVGQINVYPRPQITVNDPGASFALDPLRPPHALAFTSSVLGDGGGTNPTYRWLRSEPNGTGADIEFATVATNVVYEFVDPGVYEIVLEVETNGPNGTRFRTQSAPRTVTVSASTLTQWIGQAVQAAGASCVNCHQGSNPPAGLRWDGTPFEIYQRIVSDGMGNPIFSQNCATDRRLIQPGDPENSVVYNVLLEPSGPLCPINMRGQLPGDNERKDAHVAVLRSWIMDGAPNN